ncbi:hypothetical protein PA905_30060 [Planktothrix agardhii CCAP 1459/11A]|jgi:hypothetical protein|uniref:Uncharacterized protein n=2 Tax=Planktothrix TaxID=54304 RepID=A0A4V0XUT6_PLAAG|nr:hypothetical protein PLAN_41200 [Planktothrix rubescens NIVA-CYA 18]CAD0233050.1 conserved hypothetical protein [Planktothrix agardhii]CAD5943736.1 hypothetical protein NO108_02472 [Planktothrix rubescens]GDZ94969.1 hypothetical protein PA905_30060 [Planktothrix agardhii CCAP 1459/11A]CAD5922600.1 hypothetical protein PCC7821_00752 [Planktothrix rubescens NIVA-CYA 18]
MLSDKFTAALVYATELHAKQIRKGSGVPYIAHLLGVASITLEYGANKEKFNKLVIPKPINILFNFKSPFTIGFIQAIA